MHIEPFGSVTSLQQWASHDRVFADEGEYEAMAMSLESTDLDLLLPVLVSSHTEPKLKPMIAAAVAQHLYRALSHNEVPPRVVDAATVRSVAASLEAAPELKRELPPYVLQVLEPYAKHAK